MAYARFGGSLHRSTDRIAVHEDGIWRFQPLVGEAYQIDVDKAPS